MRELNFQTATVKRERVGESDKKIGNELKEKSLMKATHGAKITDTRTYKENRKIKT